MKKLTFIILTFAFAMSVHAQLDIDKITKSNRAKEILDEFSGENFDTWIPTLILRGKVKSYKMKWKVYEYINNERNISEGIEQETISFLFDEQLRLIEMTYQDNNIFETILDYKYKLSSKHYEQIKLNKKHREMWKSTTIDFIFNEDNKIGKANINESGNEYGTIRQTLNYKYSPNGNLLLIETDEKNSYNDEFQKLYLYEYENGKPVRILSPDKYDGEDNKESLDVDCELKYDSEGKLIVINKQYEDELHLIYDEMGNVKQEIEMSGSDTTKVVTYQYNNLNEEIGRTEERYRYSHITLSSPENSNKLEITGKTITEYEGHVDISETEYKLTENGTFQVYPRITSELQHDSYGNIIEQIKRKENGEIIEKIVFEIEYY